MPDVDLHLTAALAQQPYPLLFVTISGAHLYGFPSADSDYDLRGVHLLPLSELVGLILGQETIELSNLQSDLQIDLVTHEIKKFLGLLLKRNGYVLEQLYSPLIIHTTPEHEELKAIAKRCITRHHYYHYLGFAKTQWRLFEKECPPKVKPLLYVYRVLLTGIHLMETGAVEANVVKLNEKFQLPYLPDLIQAKVSGAERESLATANIEFHQKEYWRLCDVLVNASQGSRLPNEPSARADLHAFLIGLRLGH